MNKRELSAYMAKIGAKGGKKSRRVLTSKQAKEMARLSLKSKQQKKAT